MNDKIEKILKELADVGLYEGKMISFSKSLYRSEHPNNDVIFNANLFIEYDDPDNKEQTAIKIWYGDVDLTIWHDKLTEIAYNNNSTLYFLREMDGRFENENISLEQVKEKAHKKYEI